MNATFAPIETAAVTYRACRICTQRVNSHNTSSAGAFMAHATTRSCLVRRAERRVGHDPHRQLNFVVKKAIRLCVERHVLFAPDQPGAGAPTPAVTCRHCLGPQSKTAPSGLMHHLVGCVGVTPVVREVEESLATALGVPIDGSSPGP